MNARVRPLVASALIAALAACGGGSTGPNPNTVATVDVSPSSASINVSATQQLVASPKNSQGGVVAGKSATWNSSAPAVASVSATGLVTGVGAGSATITATVDGKSGTSAITVIALPVNTVTVSPALSTVAVGATAQLTVTLADVNGAALTGRTITYTSSNASVATVSTSGLVTGVATGTTVITATSEGKIGTATVNVTPNTSQTFAATGRVVDAAGTSGVPGARVTAQDANAVVLSSTTTDANGGWTISGLPLGGSVQFAVSASGYVSTSVAPATVTAALTVENVPLARSSASAGVVSGRARDASNNNAIATGVAVELREGVGSVTGLAAYTATTAADGSYSISGITAGTYTLMMRGVGYAQTSRTIAVTGGATLANADVSLSANANANQWRAVLTWTSASRDLDLYLTLPGAGTSRQQIYFLQPGNCAAAPFACLDRDASTAPGPETITISTLGTGIYRFYVQNYNAPSSASDSTLMNSGAQVRVYRGTTQVASYNVPQSGGTLWTVFELDGATGTITAKNTMAAGAPGDPVMAMRAGVPAVAKGGKRDLGLRLP